MRPGGGDTFADVAKMYGSASEKAGRTIGYRVYEVTAGMPTPTFFLFTSVAAFADFDKLVAEDEATMKATPPDAFKAFDEKLMSAETYRMQLSPQMSYVPKEVRASDPAFWMPKKADCAQADAGGDRSRRRRTDGPHGRRTTNGPPPLWPIVALRQNATSGAAGTSQT